MIFLSTSYCLFNELCSKAVEQSSYLLSVHFVVVYSSYVIVVLFSVHFPRTVELKETKPIKSNSLTL